MANLKPNQMVYAYHGPLIYEAKILKMKNAKDSFILNADLQQEPLSQNHKFNAQKWENVTCYYLHYQGWNSKWDEWVGIDRILEINEENKFKKQELEQLTKRKRVKREPSVGATDLASRNGPHGNKKAKANGTSASSSNNSAPQSSKSSTKKQPVVVNLTFPPELKYLLVNDWQYITKDKKLVDLPTQHNVADILHDYKIWRSQKLQAHQISILTEILQGLEVYFDKSLSFLLLYKYENLQYLDLLKNNTITQDHTQAHVYGVEHLLRLLVSLPGLISQTTMDALSINVLVSEVEELLKYLKDRISDYQNEYVYMSPQYDSLARV
ncbi:EAF3 [Candida theae]|uniref:Chromatin modification-related protein EAF3 n=1 Tax=Candida theae TaxID=1198502 RepID=A0AAD5FWR4_9ASCO|nr:EAF3 [Candida theae]KAI5949528.1 EAF3 [Candida theae]